MSVQFVQLDGSFLPCSRCAADAGFIFCSRAYCSLNCASHDRVASIASNLAHAVEDGRGGSPVAMESAERLLDLLVTLKLEPVLPPPDPDTRPLKICPRCWRPTYMMQNVVGHDDQVEYCNPCDWWADNKDDEAVL